VSDGQSERRPAADGYSLVVTAAPDPAEVQAIRGGLEAHNAAQGVPGDWVPLAVVVRDEQGSVVGGLTGGTYWGWLYISHMWIHEGLRGQRHGSRVLLEAQAEAVKRGCHHAYLDPQDFQALPFYLNRGYTVYGELQDMPLGHTRYSLQKRLEVG
jgi:GNAT superfamily N-acetyltransferase